MQSFTSLSHLLAKLQVTSPLVGKPATSSKTTSKVVSNSHVAGNCIKFAAWFQPVFPGRYCDADIWLMLWCSFLTDAVMQLPDTCFDVASWQMLWCSFLTVAVM